MSIGNILVVDDEPEIRGLLQDILQDEGYAVSVAADAAQAKAACLERKPDLVLLDIWMPDKDGITLLKEWTENEDEPAFQVIMMSGHGTIETAVEATRLGAYDFLEKPLSMAKLLLTVERALTAWQLEQENRGLRHKAAVLDEPIGRSQTMQQLRQQAQSVAQHDNPVLLSGEAGSGKETLARYIHKLSPKRDAPFVSLRIGAIASDNTERAIFGHEQGEQVYYGHLEQAHCGILFLDEVAELDLETQGRLLSALQESAFLRVDGAKEIRVSVRVIASTSIDLQQAVRDGRFRDDLYYFLHVLPIHVPALREHAEDIPDLVQFYTDCFVRSDDLPFRSFSVGAQNQLRHYDWPGNIRELKNLIQRLMILGQDETIEADDVQRALGKTTAADSRGGQGGGIADELMQLPLREAREAFERHYLQYQLAQAGASVSKLADMVGMERTHLYRKLKSLGIGPKKTGTEK